MREIWMPVKDYVGLYEVSNLGRVKSLVKMWVGANGGVGSHEEIILKTGCNPRGYPQVALYKNKQRKCISIHILVAKAFLPNPLELPQVNHKDENKANNFVWVNEDGTIDPERSNLEWCTNKYNCNYGTHNQRVFEKTTNGKLSKPVLQFTLKGEFVREWPSMAEVERQTGYFHNQISKCCLGKIKTTYGFKWSYAVPK